MLCVYPKGYGRGGIVYKRSYDGGLTWTDRLPTPPSWETSREVPTMHRVIDAAGKKRIAPPPIPAPALSQTSGLKKQFPSSSLKQAGTCREIDQTLP